MTTTMTEAPLWPLTELHAALAERARGQYHARHPFNLRMHSGELDRRALRRWILNRFHYQRHIPIKDAVLLSRLTDRDERRAWIRRIHDHDGTADDPGGIERWLVLGEAAGLDRELLLSGEGVLPAVRFAVDGYVNFCRHQSVLEAIASSLTELFAPDLMVTRIAAWQDHYPWIRPEGLRYFQVRVHQGRDDGQEALRMVHRRIRTPDDQQRVLDAFTFKCQVLWTLLDTVDTADDR